MSETPAPTDDAAPEPTPGLGPTPTDASTPPSQPTQPTYAFDNKAYAEFRLSLPEDVRDQPFFTNVKDFADLATQAHNAQKLIGVDKLPAPREDWKESEWNDFYKRLGRPEQPDGYKPVEFPEQVRSLVDPEGVKQWDSVFHKAGLTEAQRAIVLDHYSQNLTQVTESQRAAQTQAIETGLATLRQEWNDDFDANLEIANVAFRKVAPQALQDLINQDKSLANHPGVLTLFHQIGKEMLDSDARGGGAQRLVVANAAQAQQRIAQIRETHRTLLYTDPMSLKPHERQQREDLLKEIQELHFKAHPKESE